MKLSDAKIGDMVLGYYALSQCELIPFTGGVRLQLEFRDASGKVPGVMWNEEAEMAYQQLRTAEVVKIKALLSSYKGTPQLQIEKIRPAKAEEYDLTELLPSSESSLEELEQAVSELVELIEDAEIKNLVNDVLSDPQVRPRYFEAPAGTRWHHPYLRGLAEHSVSMARVAVKVCEHYAYLDRSLVIAGALLHDLGKIEELTVGSTLEYSSEGRLFGHMVIGYELLRSHAVKLGIADDINVKKLLHMVLSHQGKKEYSAPVEPAFEEAFVLYFIDELDSKLNAISRIRSKPENEGQEFSEWVNLLGTYLYLGKKEPPGSLSKSE
jgi:3'-5' exoribonuclease